MRPSAALLLMCISVRAAFAQSCTDADGNSYQIVTIGSQVWMAENLRTTHYNNADIIPTSLSNSAWTNTLVGAYAVFQDNAANVPIGGRLYNWYAVADARGICPIGWRVPTDDDWKTLESYLGMPVDEVNSMASSRGEDENVGGQLKSTQFWASPNTGANNNSGFTAVPAGVKWYNGTYYYPNADVHFWSITDDDDGPITRNIINYAQWVGRGHAWKNFGFSCRCIWDDTGSSLPDIDMKSVSIFPNPIGNDLLTIDMRASVALFSISDQQGRLIISGSLNRGRNQVDLSRLSAGVYSLRIAHRMSIIVKTF